MIHGNDDVDLFVPLFHIAVSLGDLFQRVASVDDWFYLPHLDQLGEENKIFDLLTCQSQARSQILCTQSLSCHSPGLLFKLGYIFNAYI